MEENLTIIKNYIKANLFDFLWFGNDYIYNKIHSVIGGNNEDITKILNEHFSYEIFKSEDEKLYRDGFLVSEDNLLYYTTLIDNVIEKYKRTYDTNNS